MDLEQAIKTALEFENKVCGTYAEAMEKAEDPVARRVFGTLAREEQGHVEYLEHCLDQWKKEGKLTPETLATAIPSEEQIARGLEEMKSKVEARRDASTVEVELLQKAIEAEEATSNYYKQMVGQLDETGQKLFRRFVEIEEGHLAIVKAEMDSVQGLGYWFDMPEWQFQDG